MEGAAVPVKSLPLAKPRYREGQMVTTTSSKRWCPHGRRAHKALLPPACVPPLYSVRRYKRAGDACLCRSPAAEHKAHRPHTPASGPSRGPVQHGSVGNTAATPSRWNNGHPLASGATPLMESSLTPPL